MKKYSIPLLLFMVFLLTPLYGEEKPLIIPQPQEINYFNEDMIIGTVPLIESYFCEEERPLEKMTEELETIFSRLDEPSDEEGITIILGDISSSEWEKADLNKDVSLPEEEEGYTLVTRDDSIIILGADSRGVFYGFQTLKQLLNHETDRIRVPLLEIKDYPKLQWRGIHFFTGREALQEQKQLIDFMAMNKMNHAVMQLDYMKFKNFPEMHYEPRAQSREDVKKLVEYARDRYITIVPMVPSFGHAEWAFRTGHYMDIAEQKEDPRAFRVNYPRTYEVLFQIYDEVIDIFEPEWFHIGFDEVDHPDLGKYPYREETKEYTMEELIEMHLGELAEYLGKKGIETIVLWGDMYLSREDAPTTSPAAASAPSPEIARERRDILINQHEKEETPRLLITDWHYQPNAKEKFTSLNVWHKDGFETIASTWYNPTNVRNFTHKAIEEGSLGMLQTTWAGFNFSIVDNEAHHNQFEAYLLAADYSWSGRQEKAADLPYDYSREFWRRWDAQLQQADGTISLKSLPLKEQVRLFERDLDSNVRLAIPQRPVDREQDLTYYWEFSITNPFDRELEIHADNDLIDEKKKFTLAPLQSIETQRVSMTIPWDEVRPTEPLAVNFTASLADMEDIVLERKENLPLLWVSQELKEPPVIDGDLSDWENIPSYEMADEGFVDQKTDWCPEDLSAEVYLGHYDEKLYFAFEVRDDEHYNAYDPPSLWQGDAIQMAIDFMHERSTYYRENDIEIGFALHNDGDIMRYSWYPREGPDKGFMHKTDVAIVREEPYTIYEIMIPLDILSEEKITDRTDFGFAFCINDNDGQGFDGGMIGSQGIWGSKDPSLFGVLVLDEMKEECGNE